jgi:hypothetical protein
MARIPDPVPGLLFRYGYLWLEEYRNNQIDPSKDRPACIAMRVTDKPNLGLQVAGGSRLEPGDVIIFPITTRPPVTSGGSVELSVEEKGLCRLDPGSRSWLILSEFNADSWPNADISRIPGTDRFAYGMAPPGLMRRIVRQLEELRRTKTILGVKRYVAE